jgi:lipopolysaccharide assembly outer membrane protein LptD (OstA)
MGLMAPLLTAGAPNTTKPAAVQEESEVALSAAYFAWEDGKVGEQGRLYGGVEMKYKDALFQTAEVYYKETDSEHSAVSSGAVTITTPDTRITGDRLSVDFQANLAVVTGHVKMVAKPKPPKEKPASTKSLRTQDDVTVTCDRVDYYYRIRKANASGNLALAQGKRHFTADLGMYFQAKGVLVLDGNVKGTDERGQTHSAGMVKLYLEGEQRYSLEGERYQGVLKIRHTVAEKESAEPPVLPGAPPANPADRGGSEAAPAEPTTKAAE